MLSERAGCEDDQQAHEHHLFPLPRVEAFVTPFAAKGLDLGGLQNPIHELGNEGRILRDRQRGQIETL